MHEMVPCEHPLSFIKYRPIDDYGEHYLRVCTLCKGVLGESTLDEKRTDLENRPGYNDGPIYDASERYQRDDMYEYDDRYERKGEENENAVD